MQKRLVTSLSPARYATMCSCTSFSLSMSLFELLPWLILVAPPPLFLLKKVVICRDFLGNFLSIFFRAFSFLLFLLVFLRSQVE